MVISKKSLKVLLITLIIIFIIVVSVTLLTLNQPMISLSMLLGAINWPIFIILFLLIIIVAIAYWKSK